MERLLDQEASKQVKEILKDMKDNVKVTFISKDNCEPCDFTWKLISEIQELNTLISIEKLELNDETKTKYGVEDAPAYLISNSNYESRGAFYGVPAGHEVNTLISNLLDASNARPLYDEATVNKIKAIDKKTNVKVFVTAQCPHCPGAAINAFKLAQLNKNITAQVYEVSTFHKTATKYKVSSVPKIVIDETKEFVGNQPIATYLDKIGV